MNITKNAASIAPAVLLLGLAIFAGACQNAANTTSVSTANANQSANAANQTNSSAARDSHGSHATMNHDMAGMNHAEMMTSDANAASQPYDLQFLDTMTAHHQGAVEMAEMILRKSSNAELKVFAEKIIADQKKEIAQMKDWREKWFAGRPRALNMEMRGMADSMKDMMGDGMKKWEAMTGTDFDVRFLEMMTPHHVGAVEMSREALEKAERQEIKTLANQIIKAQEAEIKQMADWKAKWTR